MDKTVVTAIVLLTIFVSLECSHDISNNNKNRKTRMTNTPFPPYLEVDGKKITQTSLSSDASSPASITVREKKVIQVRCIIEGAPSPGVKIINWSVNDQNVTHMSQFLMEYQAKTDKFTSQSLLTINVTKDFHGETLSCSSEHPSYGIHEPVVTNAVFDVLCEYNDLSHDEGTSVLETKHSQILLITKKQ